jgi:hypothetical protein
MILGGPMTDSLAGLRADLTRGDVLRAIQEYDRLESAGFFSEHGCGQTTTYELVWDERRYPPQGILGTAYELATGQRLGSGDSRAARAAPSTCLESWDSPAPGGKENSDG